MNFLQHEKSSNVLIGSKTLIFIYKMFWYCYHNFI